MGSYLSRPCPGPPSHALPGADSRERLERLGFAFPARRDPWGIPTLDLASPPRLGDHRGYVVVHGRPYPSQQAQCWFLEVFSAVPRSSPQTPAPAACSFRVFCTSVMAKVASAKGKLTLPVALMQTAICRWSPLCRHLPAAGAKDAREQSGALRAKGEKDPTAPVGRGTGPARQEEAHRVPERQDRPGRGRDGGAAVRSAFTPLAVNGVLCSFVPRPGPLRRDLCSKGLEDGLKKTSQTLLSSRSQGKAITSSYRSTGGFPPPPRSHQGAAGPRGSASSHPHVPAKQAREESRRARSSASGEPPKKTTQEEVAGVSSGQKQNLKGLSPPSGNSRPQKRRIPLLLPCRRNDPLDLPLSPELAYAITAEDLGLEKRAALQWINKVLEG